MKTNHGKQKTKTASELKAERLEALKAEIARGRRRRDAERIARRLGVSRHWVNNNWTACASEASELKIGRASWRTLRARLDAATAAGMLIYEKWEASLTDAARTALNQKFWRHCVQRGLASKALREANAMRAFWREAPFRRSDAEAGRVSAGTLRAALRAAIYTQARRELGRSIGSKKAILARASAEFERLEI